MSFQNHVSSGQFRLNELISKFIRKKLVHAKKPEGREICCKTLNLKEWKITEGNSSGFCMIQILLNEI
jgi:hypothetical protein